MPASIPTLGYRSQRRAIFALRSQNLQPAEIAHKIGGLYARNVSAALQDSKRKTVQVPRDVIAALEPYAVRRGIKATKLAMLIISTAADEGMVDAILDDV